MYAQLEEEHGLAKRAMSIFDRATQVVADEDKFEVKFFFYFICSTQINNSWYILLDVYYLYRQSDG